MGYRSADGCLSVQFAGTFVLQTALHGPLRKLMTPMAPPRPIRPPNPTTTPPPAATAPTGADGADAGVRLCRVVRLESRLSAVAAARTEVGAAIGSWCAGVDPDGGVPLA